jgi:hypothetical protein
MLTNIIYVMATTSLLIGSILTFNNEIPDYFYLIGTILFVINSCLHLIDNSKENQLSINEKISILNNNDEIEKYT